jgi:hypothetical protein
MFVVQDLMKGAKIGGHRQPLQHQRSAKGPRALTYLASLSGAAHLDFLTTLAGSVLNRQERHSLVGIFEPSCRGGPKRS